MNTTDTMATTDGDDEPSRLGQLTDIIISVLLWIRGSFLAFTGVLGVVLLLYGFLQANGVLAGMFIIWGVSAIGYAGIGYVFLRLIGYR